ncbi:hypothetical protein LguiA_027534 [Lonicera macranthoides]
MRRLPAVELKFNVDIYLLIQRLRIIKQLEPFGSGLPWGTSPQVIIRVQISGMRSDAGLVRWS